MRKRWWIMVAALIVVAALGIAARTRSSHRIDLGPLEKYIRSESTYYVPNGAGQNHPSIESWVWLSNDCRKDVPQFKHWMSQQGWIDVLSESDQILAARSSNANGILPDETMSSTQDHEFFVVIYSKRVSGATSIFYRLLYKNLDMNSPPPSSPR